MYYQDFTPISGSLALTAMFAALPILTLLVLLGGLKMRSQWAALIALGVAMAVAISVYGMPADQTGLAALEGAAFGLFPIMWIVITAIWVFNMTVESGHFAVLRRSVETVSKDQRIQAVMIGFCFGALLEALAGFGAPVAITSMMMVALGFRPLKAASLALVSNTAPVPFGAIATPITTLSNVTGLDKGDLGAMVGRQTPLLAMFLPLTLIAMVDGRRGIAQTWPVAVVAGLAFAIGQFVCSNYGSVELTDIVAALMSMAAIIAFVRVWKPNEARLRVRTGSRSHVAGLSAEGAPMPEPTIASQDDLLKDRPLEVLRAYAPYLIIIGIFSITQIPLIKDRLAESPWTASLSMARPARKHSGGRSSSDSHFQLQLVCCRRDADAHRGPHHHGGDPSVPGPRDARRWRHAQAAPVDCPDCGHSARIGLCGESVRPDDDARAMGGGRGVFLRLLITTDRLAGGSRDRLGYGLQRTLRRGASGGCARHRHIAGAARRR